MFKEDLDLEAKLLRLFSADAKTMEKLLQNQDLSDRELEESWRVHSLIFSYLKLRPSTFLNSARQIQSEKKYLETNMIQRGIVFVQAENGELSLEAR